MFIRADEVGDAAILDWTVFVTPFRPAVWKLVAGYCVACAVVIKVLGYSFSSFAPVAIVKDLVYNSYVVFRSNLGGPPYPIAGDKTAHLKAFLFSIFFASNIVWMSYRASLTSELSNRELKMPFITLEDLLESDYR